MCRNIKPLFNYDPPADLSEIRAASQQFVRKIAGFTSPSKANEASFQSAVEDITLVCSRLLNSLESRSPPRNREVQALKARARSEARLSS
ncbi:MAG TPA: DUF2277 domain-containing protein [Candidatus Dormibacteraeota bacterium]|nr:DUF2277 domain-containing protein [Candidatus Dormibacteraeota bacterium]